MTERGWTWLEVAKVALGALTPLLIFGLGVVVTRAARRVEQAQWANRKLIERRLELFDDMAGPLNDLFCFFRLVGDFQKITPPVAIEQKRCLDKLFYTHEVLMSDEFGARYHAFINACFLPYVALGHDAQLKASRKRQKAERGQRWEQGWDSFFVQEGLVTPLATIEDLYRKLMICFAEQVGAGVRWTSPGFVESGCCCRNCCAQPKVVHSFFARARACAQAREAVGIAGGVVGLVLGRGAHPQRRVQPGRVVEALDVLEDRRAQFGAGRPSCVRGAVQQALLGQRREERLGDGVVVTGPDGAHRLSHPGSSSQAKNTLAALRISFAFLSCLTSPRNRQSSSRSTLVRPSWRPPESRSA